MFKQRKHQLEETKFRGRCSECYQEMVLQGGRKHAQLVTRQIRTKCLGCNIFFCMPCFFNTHYYSDFFLRLC
ncbi:piggyBac transposable element-derived protein 4-like [Aphis craccivora]|uniref:PiggyBac transposable element-derived protein 4-like n=1 Tax=Aphis craccivora TaxID=307492 RepID=A0A6G0Y005_APHCR|nr:piggyBac transposable element-derived protein 4-like [Aphis craccivora]